MSEKLLTPLEVAGALRVDVATITRWAQTGLIHAIKLGPSRRSPLRIPESELQRALAGQLGKQR
jgi:excisionase family DNA binding protein